MWGQGESRRLPRSLVRVVSRPACPVSPTPARADFAQVPRTSTRRGAVAAGGRQAVLRRSTSPSTPPTVVTGSRCLLCVRLHVIAGLETEHAVQNETRPATQVRVTRGAAICSQFRTIGARPAAGGEVRRVPHRHNRLRRGPPREAADSTLTPCPSIA